MIPGDANLYLLGFFGMPGHYELIIVGVIVLLLFGNRLPSVMRSLGTSIVEFKKGVKGVEEDIEEQSSGGSKSSDQSAQQT